MNTTQTTDYERALARAQRAGLSIIGRGLLKSGERVYLTGSASEPGKHHVVIVHAGRLACDCPARALCTHRALAHAELQREASEAQEAIEQVRAGQKAAADAAAVAAKRETAPLARKSFSIWAAS